MEPDQPRVLVTDDNPSKRYLISSWLRGDGFRVDTAETADQALHSVAASPPDLVVLDVNLPDMHGFEVCRLIKQMPGQSSLPVLHVSGTSVTDAQRAAGLESGADGYLVEPIDPSVLIASARSLLRVRSAERRARASEDEARATAERWRAAFDAVGDAVCLVDATGTLRRANQAMLDMVGSTEEELVGHSCNEISIRLIGPMREPPYARALNERKSTKIELEHNGRWLQIMANPVEGEDGSPEAVIVIREVTNERLARDRLHHEATHDSLTGLPNRACFNERASESISGEGCGAILFIDLDRFKPINDVLGHAVGDSLLRSVAGRLQGVIRSSDTLARIGGDEFTILAPGVGSSDASALADRIVDVVSRPYRLAGHAIEIAASVGVVVYPQMGSDLDALMRLADEAMYEAKRSGQGPKVAGDARDLRTLDDVLLGGSIRSAVNAQEMIPVYQPEVDTLTRAVVGFEALVRWQHPQHGLIMPGRFLHLAEEYGAARALDRYMIRAAAEQSAKWAAQPGSQSIVWVNVGAGRIDSELAPFIEKVLEETQCDPKLLGVEVTEDAALASTEAVAALEAVTGLGVSLALDDFGTGFSMLRYLGTMPFNMVKIDRSFVARMTFDKAAKAIVRSVIGLAEDLGIACLAEGVEMEEQARMLSNLGCRLMQGFLVSRPVSAEAAAEFLASPAHAAQETG